MPRGRPIAERLAEKTERTESGCWLFRGSLQNKGYGEISYQLRPRLAHRVAYELASGPIPSGMHVLHRCDVPNCVNPAHLFLGTHADNMADSARKGRMHGSPKRERCRNFGHELTPDNRASSGECLICKRASRRRHAAKYRDKKREYDRARYLNRIRREKSA